MVCFQNNSLAISTVINFFLVRNSIIVLLGILWSISHLLSTSFGINPILPFRSSKAYTYVEPQNTWRKIICSINQASLSRIFFLRRVKNGYYFRWGFINPVKEMYSLCNYGNLKNTISFHKIIKTLGIKKDALFRMEHTLLPTGLFDSEFTGINNSSIVTWRLLS